MKQGEKEFIEKFVKFSESTKKFNCNNKLPFYLQLIEECIENNDANAYYIIPKCLEFVDSKLKMLETKFGMKAS